jgi:hypothetical protein
MRTTRIFAAVLLAVAAVLVGVSGPAAASPTNVVTANSGAATSVALKSATARCPVGTRVYGGGGDIVGGGHQVALTGLVPAFGLKTAQDSYTATAEEINGDYPATWSVYAYAICGPQLPGMTITSGRVAYSSGDRVVSSSTCPANAMPVGLGAAVSPAAGTMVLNESLGNYTRNAFGTLFGWSAAIAFVTESGHVPAGVGLTSYAVCATLSTAPAYVFADSAYDTTATKTVNATCPTGRTYGVGGYLSFATGQLYFDSMVPSGASWDQAAVDGRADQSGFTDGPWWATSEAICAP